jgi:acylphosphatase
VKNQRDGTVEALFEGDQDKVNAVLEWCNQGPPSAKVTDVNVEWQDYAGEFSGFGITY